MGEPVAFLYNGVRVSALPDYDHNAYPYAVLAYVHSQQKEIFFRYSEKNITVNEKGYCDLLPDGKTFKLDDGAWRNDVGSWVNSIFWANHDVYYENAVGGEPYLSASEPVPQ